MYFVSSWKDDVNILLDKANLESQENIGFIKATKILMKKNSMDIMKIKEFFQKYEYNLHAKKNSVVEQGVTDSKPESSSVQFSCSVMSDSLWPHELQHARPPCPFHPYYVPACAPTTRQ